MSPRRFSKHLVRRFSLAARAALVVLGALVALVVLVSLLPGPVSASVSAAPVEKLEWPTEGGAPLSIAAPLAPPTSTTTTITQDTPDPSLVGQAIPVQFQVAANASVGDPLAGTVTVRDGTGASCSDYTAGSSPAGTWTGSCDLTPTTAGVKTLTASFDPDDPNLFSGSTSAGESHQVNKTPVTITVSASPTSTVYGQMVTFTASISPSTCSGVVFFDDAGTEIGRAVVEGGTASERTFRLGAGLHEIKAVYLGSDTCSAAESDVEELTVARASTKVDPLASSVNPSVYGQFVVFSATVGISETAVVSGTPAPTGLVTFWSDDGDYKLVMGQESLNGDGIAWVGTSDLAVNTYTITASYQGDPNYKPSEEILSHDVIKADTVVTVTGPNSSYYGKSVTFDAEVSAVPPGAGTPTGVVTFTGWVTDPVVASLYDGKASYTVMEPHDVPLAVILATYSGDDNFNGSSGIKTHIVTSTRTTTEIRDPINETDYGQDAQFIISVKRHEDEPGMGTPTGSVILFAGPLVITETLPAGTPVTTIVTNTLPPGVYNPLAWYICDTLNFRPSWSAPVTHTVRRAESETSLRSSVNPSSYGQSLTFTATVEASGLGANAPISPGGTVTFTLGTVGTVTATLDASGIASVVTDTLPTGEHEITAAYGGNNWFKPSEDSLRQTVSKVGTTTALSSSHAPGNSSAINEPVTFTATVRADAAPVTVTVGTVTFYDGLSEPVGCTALTLSPSGQATCTVAFATTGLHPMKAVYNGTSNYQASTSGRLRHTVGAAETTTTLSASSTSVVYGETITFTARVTETDTGNPVTGGTVTFKDGTATIGSGTLDASGMVTITNSSLAAGSHPIKARFAGNATFAGSESPVVNVTVNKADTTVDVSSSPSPSVFGQSVTIAVTVTANAPGAGTPTGPVTITVGSTVYGTVLLDGTGRAVLVTSAMPVGSAQTITADYGGNDNFNGNSDTTLHTVNAASTTTTVKSSPNPSLTDEEITVTANVTAQSGSTATPTGTVTFSYNSTSIGSSPLVNGSASITHTFTLSGTYTITATYTNSAGNFANSSGSTTHYVNVTPPDLTVTKTDSPDPVNAGDDLTYVVNVTNNETDAVAVTVVDTLPTKANYSSATPSQGSCSQTGGVVTCPLGSLPGGGSASVTIIVNVPSDTPAGTVLKNTAEANGVQSDTEETTVYRSPRLGDCNGDGAVNVSDVWDIVRDIFDPTYAGTTGCDANEDRRVDAGDVPSAVRIMAEGLTAGGASGDLRNVAGGPALSMPEQVGGAPGTQTAVRVSFQANGHSITSLAFSVNYDESWLRLDPTDRDGNGIPDNVLLSLPGEFSTSVDLDEQDTDGELDVFVGDISPPLNSVPDQPILFLLLDVDSPPGETKMAVQFSPDPQASFGDTAGRSVPGVATPGPYPYRAYLPLIR